MYIKPQSRRRSSFGDPRSILLAAIACWIALVADGRLAFGQADSNLIRNISNANERLEMTVNTSQVLTLQSRIPRLVVNNPDLVTATPISENQVQIAARKPGVTQINLWDENGKVFTVDLLIFGDVRELELTLKNMFPASALRIRKLTNSLVLEGQVDRPEIVSTIRQLAEDYAPKVVNNISVGGAQQVALKVKVMEVSRTRLRKLGFDWFLSNGADFVASSASDILQGFSTSTGTASSAGSTIDFGIVNGDTRFLGLLDALQQSNVSKVLADPTITTVSGRPAHFNVGGELPIIVPSGLGQVGIEYKEFGTQVDFVPIVLGNGRIRLEVRPRVSEIDDTRSVTINSFIVPALKVRQVDCGVELNAGQTLALAGLIQERIESVKRGVPFLADLPGIGAAFRKVEEEANEIELLILVTPEFVEALDPHELPQCGPGMESVSPTHCDLYWKGHLETPNCGPCGQQGCLNPSCRAHGCQTGNCNQHSGAHFGEPQYNGVPVENGTMVPAPTSPDAMQNFPSPSEALQEEWQSTSPDLAPGAEGSAAPAEGVAPSGEGETTAPAPADGTQPGAPAPNLPNVPNVPNDSHLEEIPDPSAHRGAPWFRSGSYRNAQTSQSVPPSPYSGLGRAAARWRSSTPGLLGPVGYDVQK